MATTVFFVSGTSLTIPSNYNTASNTWEAIGGGGGASYGAGAGGGEYRKITNASYTSSATRTILIGTGGAGATTNGSAGGAGNWVSLLADNNSTVALRAMGGTNTNYGSTTGGAGGTGGTGAGGNANGGAGGSCNGAGGGAGGGAAGGPGGVGGSGGGATSNGGGGGGGSNGGASASASSTAAGSAGGNGQGGTGGGGGGTTTAGVAGTAGTGAGGGGGGGSSTTFAGGAGATGSIWTQTSNSAVAGPGGGGGGTGGNGASVHGSRTGGNGGLYGGGGSGDGNFSSGNVAGGSGAQGILVLTYTPASSGSPYTLAAATGAVALAGQAAALTRTVAGGQVQKNGGTVSANASIATSLPGATTAGNTILIFASGGGTITTPSGFTSRSPAVNALGCYIFEKLVASGNSTDTPTLTMSGAYDAVWQIAEYKNITAYDTSASTFVASAAPGPYSTPTITPASGNKRIFGFIGSTVTSGGGFAAGDPQSWTNTFVGQQSNLLVGPGGAGRTPIASGWSDLLAAANGASSYSTTANIGTGSSTLLPHSIIAAYTTTDIPPVNPWPTFRSISSVGYASHTNTVVTAPTGIIDGDILILTIAVFGAPTPVAVTLPSGFTLISKSTAGAGGFNVDMSVAWKRASSESGSYTITHATAANTNAFIAVYSGCIASGSPVDTYVFNTGLGATTDTTNLVSSVANTTALYIDHDWTAGGGRSPPTPMVERYENLTYLSDNPLPTSGTSGRVIATNSNVTGGDPWAAWSVLLKPAVSAGGSPYTMPAATGTVTLAGTATGLRAARRLPATTGAIALAGTTAGLRAARTLTAAKGSIALAGLATGLRAARILTAVKGSIVLTGFAAGLVYSSFKTLTAAVGSITLAGQAATFRLTRVMAAAKGTISLTGFDVVLTKTSAVVNKILTAAAGAFTFVGQDAALRRERRLAAAPGAITLAGQAAVLRVTRMLAAAKGTITLAGSDTLLLKGKSPLLATTGAILVTGNTANLVYRASYRMAASSASIRVAGREAGLSRSGTEQPGTMEFGRKAYLRRW